MRLSNCNCGKMIECGCVPYFDSFVNNTVSVLSVGNLVSNTCVFDEYVIDWYRDNEHAMVSGKGYDPDIEAHHPFVGDAALPVVGGQWKPVLRYVVVGGIKIYPTPKKCQNWCSDLDVALPSAEVPYINVINLACGMTGGNPATWYDYRINYNTTQDFTLATKTIRFFLDEQTGYVAYQFTASIVADQIEIYYNAENVPLAQYIVGTDLPSNNLNVLPEEIDNNLIKSVVNLSGRTFAEGDYLTVKVRPSVKDPNNYNTVWTLDLKCLPHGSFPCTEFNAGLRTIDLSTVVISWDSVNCRYVVRFRTVNGLVSGNFSRYITPTWTIGANTVSNAALGEYTMYMRRLIQGTVYVVLSTANFVNMQGIKTSTKNGNILTFEFTHETDYSDYKTQFANLQNNAFYRQYSEDTLSLHHYKWYYLIWRDTMMSCGDTFVSRSFNFHLSSPITFDDGSRKITIEMLNVANGMPPLTECNTVYAMVNSYITSTANSINLADFVSQTRCRSAYPFNMRYQSSSNLNETQIIRNGYYYLHSASLDTVCQKPDWYVLPSTLRYAFNVCFVRVTLTDPDDALNNFRIESQLDVSTGQSTGTWATVYEKSNGNQIIP